MTLHLPARRHGRLGGLVLGKRILVDASNADGGLELSKLFSENAAEDFGSSFLGPIEKRL